MTIARRGLLALLLPPLVLGGCSAAITGGGDPPRLFTVNPRSGFSNDLPRVDWNLEIPVPTAPQGLNTQRIALRRSPVTLEYYANVTWTDAAPEMVQTALVQTFENSARIAGVGRDSTRFRSDYILATELRDLQADYDNGNGPPQATVRIVARLIRLPDRAIVGGQVFTQAIRADGTAIDRVALAFDEAVGQACRQIVEWTLRAAGHTQRLARP